MLSLLTPSLPTMTAGPSTAQPGRATDAIFVLDLPAPATDLAGATDLPGATGAMPDMAGGRQAIARSGATLPVTVPGVLPATVPGTLPVTLATLPEAVPGSGGLTVQGMDADQPCSPPATPVAPAIARCEVLLPQRRVPPMIRPAAPETPGIDPAIGDLPPPIIARPVARLAPEDEAVPPPVTDQPTASPEVAATGIKAPPAAAAPLAPTLVETRPLAPAPLAAPPQHTQPAQPAMLAAAAPAAKVVLDPALAEAVDLLPDAPDTFLPADPKVEATPAQPRPDAAPPPATTPAPPKETVPPRFRLCGGPERFEPLPPTQGKPTGPKPEVEGDPRPFAPDTETVRGQPAFVPPDLLPAAPFVPVEPEERAAAAPPPRAAVAEAQIAAPATKTAAPTPTPMPVAEPLVPASPTPAEAGAAARPPATAPLPIAGQTRDNGPATASAMREAAPSIAIPQDARAMPTIPAGPAAVVPQAIQASDPLVARPTSEPAIVPAATTDPLPRPAPVLEAAPPPGSLRPTQAAPSVATAPVPLAAPTSTSPMAAAPPPLASPTMAQAQAQTPIAPILPISPPADAPTAEQPLPVRSAAGPSAGTEARLAAPPLAGPPAPPVNAAARLAPAPAREVFAAAIERSRRAPAGGGSTTGAAPAEMLAAVTPAAVRPASPAPDVPLDMTAARWTEDMVSRIERMLDRADASDGRVRLRPDALGNVDLTVRSEAGQVHVHFRAEVAETRQLLRDAAPRLADAAEARGLQLGDASVSGGSPQEQSRQEARRAPTTLSNRRAPQEARGEPTPEQRLA